MGAAMGLFGGRGNGDARRALKSANAKYQEFFFTHKPKGLDDVGRRFLPTLTSEELRAFTLHAGSPDRWRRYVTEDGTLRETPLPPDGTE